MKLVVYSISHQNCPVPLREKVSLSAGHRRTLLRRMHAEDNISEAVLLSTCNRIEFYAYVRADFDAGQYFADLLDEIGEDMGQVWRQYSSLLEQAGAVRHLFEVSAGLDSQIPGENQILAQVKEAYTESVNCRMSKVIFHRLFHMAFRAGKAVRAQTGINCGAVSVSMAAVEVARQRLNIEDCSAMIIGAGDNAELAARYLFKAGLRDLVIANRSAKTAKEMVTRLGTGQVISLGEIAGRLSDIDIVISSTGSEKVILKAETIGRTVADRVGPLLMLDVAVPRDIDPAAGDFENVVLYNIDDLTANVESNQMLRSERCEQARVIVADFVDKFIGWYESLDVVPVISELLEQGKAMAREEARRYASGFGKANSKRLEVFAESLVQKILHGPVDFLKAGGEGEPSEEQLRAAEMIQKIFSLDKEQQD